MLVNIIVGDHNSKKIQAYLLHKTSFIMYHDIIYNVPPLLVLCLVFSNNKSVTKCK